jgi:glycosyltransferase involved in cell wall biosynthesis
VAVSGRVWITWEKHQRTRTLAASFHAELHEFGYEHWGSYRFFLAVPWTIWRLLRLRPRCLVIQNPSMVLAVLVCLLKPLFRYRLIVDRHTTFLFDAPQPLSWSDRLYERASEFTLRVADLTIVTNRFLHDLVEGHGGSAFVLPDKFPVLNGSPPTELPAHPWGVLVCSFAADEPYAEVIEAARQLDGQVTLLITGNTKRADPAVVARAPSNVRFTGFVPDAQYAGLLRAADFVVVLTRAEHCLVCGGYEAVAVETPLVVSGTNALREFYEDAAVYVGNDSLTIRRGLEQVLAGLPQRREQIRAFRIEKEAEWNLQAEVLIARLDRLS